MTGPGLHRHRPGGDRIGIFPGQQRGDGELGVAEAVELLRDARRGFPTVGGEQNPAVLVASNNLAMALKASGELEEAGLLYREVAEASRNRLGSEHRSTLAAMHNLAVLLVARDLAEEAEGLMRASLDIKRRTLAPGHPSTLTSVNGLAGLLARGGRNDEADALFDEAYRGRSQALGVDHPVTVKTLMSFAAYLAATGRSADAPSVLESWLGVTDGHHTLSHEPDDNKDAVENLIKINEWFAGELAYLAKKLAETPEPGGDGSMLDNTLIVWLNELGKGNSHTLDDIPFVLVAGKGLGIPGGRALSFDKFAHNRLWLTIARSMGHEIDTFGTAKFCEGGPLDLG